MTVHLLTEDLKSSLCGEQEDGDLAVTLDQALSDESANHFDCVGCHRVLTGDNKHTPQESG